MNFLNALEPLLKSFWFIAIPVSIIFIIQTVLTFIGADASDGTTADFDSDLSDGDTPFQLFSFRNLINFLLGFSWSGISFYNIVNSKALLIIIAILIGCCFILIFFLIVRQLMKLAEDSSFKIICNASRL